MFTKKSRRYFERQPSTLPVQVRYFLGMPEAYSEETHVINVSRGGARLVLSQEVQMGQPVELTLALSRLLRAYDKNEKMYTVWGIIRSVACLMRGATGQVGYEIGVAFIGQFPPDGYLADPTKRYDLKPTPSSDGFWQPRELSKKELEMMANW
ncbi:MAG TPA: PilZ domain-containing protein [Blastocatellia bacterium]|nr:PilZ domain-containing protein [Blastocatellia bacterium]